MFGRAQAHSVPIVAERAIHCKSREQMKFSHVDAACDTARLGLQNWIAELEPPALAIAGGGGLTAERPEDRCEAKHIPQYDPNQIFTEQRRGRERR